MTTAEQVNRTTGARPQSIDIAGTRWPIYKLEAIAAGLFTLLLAFVLIQSLQVAVLSAATVAAVAWIVGLVRQTSRSE